MITFFWCLLWVQSLPLSLLSSFLLCVLCVLRVSWLWWTSLPTVGLTARGAPLWPLCVSADQGRGGSGCGGGLGLDGFGLQWWWQWVLWLPWFNASLGAAGAWGIYGSKLSCFAKSTEVTCRTNCYVLNIRRLQFFAKKKEKMCFKCLWFEMTTKLILWLSLWMTSALSNSLEITNMHVQGVSWIFVN